MLLERGSGKLFVCLAAITKRPASG
jgi:hypothetical protein